MKIYLASSWRNKVAVLALKKFLVEEGHEVDAFCDPSDGRYVFDWRDLPNAEQLNAKTFLQDERTQRACREDIAKIEWADALVLILPCGRSSHWEAGEVKGRGKKVFIYGPMPAGEFDVLYARADGIFKYVGALMAALRFDVK